MDFGDPEPSHLPNLTTLRKAKHEQNQLEVAHKNPILSLHSLKYRSSEDLLTPSKDVVMSLEGDTVTLSCKYSGSETYFFWYKQKPNSHPEFLIAYYSGKTERMKFIHDDQKKEFHLEISSAAVSDSAVYYCALLSGGHFY
uniref:Ig-like domain-containing protein n=1 Tax=Neolamprologus brichardi TaxID=32507 RepID=A0A3Q4H4M2_NEOBR